MTNVIQDTIEKNNDIFSEKWEVTHNHINHCLGEVHLLKNRVVDLEALSGLQQTALQSCQNTIAGLEETVTGLTATVTKLEKLVCYYRDCLLSPALLVAFHVPTLYCAQFHATGIELLLLDVHL